MWTAAKCGLSAMTKTCLKILWAILRNGLCGHLADARDLHADEPAWNIRTEHEAMFTEMGIPIKALIAKKLPGNICAQKKAAAGAEAE